jgi:hypothetical protein
VVVLVVVVFIGLSVQVWWCGHHDGRPVGNRVDAG